MGKATAISIHGVDLWFNSLDHLPPHLHATKAGHWEIGVYLLSTTEDTLVYDLKWPRKAGAGPSAALQRTLRRAVVANRAPLLLQWEQKVAPPEDLG